MTKAFLKKAYANPAVKKALMILLMLIVVCLMLSLMFLTTAQEQENFVYLDSIALSYELQAYTHGLCVEKGIEYELVLAVMWRESGFQIQAVGYNPNGTQDNGLMQINDVNRQWLRERCDIHD